jgi:hypothetical protein
MADLLRAGEVGWDDRLDGVARDVYHSAGYHRFAAASGGGEAFLVVIGDRARGLAWPYLLRGVADVDGLEDCGATDIDSVYGYPGPIAWGCDPGDPFLAAAWDDICDLWRSQGAVAAFTRFHPLLENVNLARGFADARAGLGGPSVDTATGPIVAGGRTVSIDCTLDDAEALADMPRSCARRSLRQGALVSLQSPMKTGRRSTRSPGFTRRQWHATAQRRGTALARRRSSASR